MVIEGITRRDGRAFSAERLRGCRGSAVDDPTGPRTADHHHRFAWRKGNLRYRSVRAARVGDGQRRRGRFNVLARSCGAARDDSAAGRYGIAECRGGRGGVHLRAVPAATRIKKAVSIHVETAFCSRPSNNTNNTKAVPGESLAEWSWRFPRSTYASTITT